MIFQEVQKLRKQGDIEGAYAKAKAAFSDSPCDTWAKKALALCLYDKLKKNATGYKRNEFCSNLIELKSLGLPSDDMVWNLTAYPIATIVRNCNEKDIIYENFDSEGFYYQLLRLIETIPFKPHTAEYSFLLQSFLEQSNTWSGTFEVCRWWGFSNFRQEDYQPITFNNKVMSQSLAEWAVVESAKTLIENFSSPLSENDMERCEFLIGEINKISPLLPQNVQQQEYYRNIAYYKVILECAIGRNDAAALEMVELLRQYPDLIWGWKKLYSLSPCDTERRIVCLCNLIQKTPYEMDIPKYKKMLCGILVNLGEYDEAKAQIETIIKDGLSENVNVSSGIFDWAIQVTKESWYGLAVAADDGKQFYSEHSNL